jgi:hypothetical protein
MRSEYIPVRISPLPLPPSQKDELQEELANERNATSVLQSLCDAKEDEIREVSDEHKKLVKEHDDAMVELTTLRELSRVRTRLERSNTFQIQSTLEEDEKDESVMSEAHSKDEREDDAEGSNDEKPLQEGEEDSLSMDDIREQLREADTSIGDLSLLLSEKDESRPLPLPPFLLHPLQSQHLNLIHLSLLSVTEIALLEEEIDDLRRIINESHAEYASEEWTSMDHDDGEAQESEERMVDAHDEVDVDGTRSIGPMEDADEETSDRIVSVNDVAKDSGARGDDPMDVSVGSQQLPEKQTKKPRRKRDLAKPRTRDGEKPSLEAERRRSNASPSIGKKEPKKSLRTRSAAGRVSGGETYPRNGVKVRSIGTMTTPVVITSPRRDGKDGRVDSRSSQPSKRHQHERSLGSRTDSKSVGTAHPDRYRRSVSSGTLLAEQESEEDIHCESPKAATSVEVHRRTRSSASRGQHGASVDFDDDGKKRESLSRHSAGGYDDEEDDTAEGKVLVHEESHHNTRGTHPHVRKGSRGARRDEIEKEEEEYCDFDAHVERWDDIEDADAALKEDYDSVGVKKTKPTSSVRSRMYEHRDRSRTMMEKEKSMTRSQHRGSHVHHVHSDSVGSVGSVGSDGYSFEEDGGVLKHEDLMDVDPHDRDEYSHGRHETIAHTEFDSDHGDFDREAEGGESQHTSSSSHPLAMRERHQVSQWSGTCLFLSSSSFIFLWDFCHSLFVVVVSLTLHLFSMHLNVLHH